MLMLWEKDSKNTTHHLISCLHTLPFSPHSPLISPDPSLYLLLPTHFHSFLSSPLPPAHRTPNLPQKNPGCHLLPEPQTAATKQEASSILALVLASLSPSFRESRVTTNLAAKPPTQRREPHTGSTLSIFSQRLALAPRGGVRAW